MKVLCPIDFSIASIDAVNYAASLIENFETRYIELLHCSFPGDVSSFFPEYLENQRSIIQESLSSLTDSMQAQAPQVQWSQQIIHGNPLDEISSYLKINEFDLVVIGTKGLRNPNDRIFGSLTETLFEKSICPILAIPQGYVFNHLKSVVFSIDEEVISSEKVVKSLVSIVKQYSSSLTLLHIKGQDERPLELNLDLDYFLKDIKYEFYSRSSEGSLTKDINDVCQDLKADLLCMIHRDRGWMLNVMHRSQVKEELDRLSMPVLILHD
jgi:nucleotide-binding universal stress UspA family protein